MWKLIDVSLLMWIRINEAKRRSVKWCYLRAVVTKRPSVVSSGKAVLRNTPNPSPRLLIPKTVEFSKVVRIVPEMWFQSKNIMDYKHSSKMPSGRLLTVRASYRISLNMSG